MYMFIAVWEKASPFDSARRPTSRFSSCCRRARRAGVTELAATETESVSQVSFER